MLDLTWARIPNHRVRRLGKQWSAINVRQTFHNLRWFKERRPNPLGEPCKAAAAVH